MLDGETAGRPLAENDPREVGPYRILSVLGSGAMGRVYLGQAGEGPAVAVKVVRADLADVTLFRKRFARELRVVRSIDGAGIARVVDADADAPQPWIATEHIAGPSVQSRVDEQGALTDLEVRALARAVAAALTEIHAAGVVHRDLKPSNVLLGPDGPKVIDFGVAHATDASVVLTGTGHIPGTPAYMSPEQAEAKAVGPATDVFALGSLLVFAATGRLAFGEGAPLAVLNRVVNGAPDLDGVAVGDARLRELIIACLAKDPAARPTPGRVIEVCDPDATHAGEAEPEAVAGVGPVAGFMPTEPVGAAQAVASPTPAGQPAAIGAAVPPAGATTATTATLEADRAGRSPHRGKIVAGGVLAALAVAGILAASLGGGGGSGAEKSGSEPAAGAKAGAAFPTGPSSESGASAAAGSQGSASPSGPTAAGGGAVPLAGSSSAPPATTAGATSGRPAGRPSTAATSPSRPAGTTTTGTATTTPPTTRPSTARPSPTDVPPGPMTEGFNISVPPWFGSATVDVSWTAHPDATSYDIHFTDDFASGTDQIYHSTGTTYSIAGVAAGSKYCITMRAVNRYGASAWYSPTYCGTI